MKTNESSNHPKCVCGCGQKVNWNNRKKEWRKFVYGHNLKQPLSKEKEKERRKKIGATMREFFKEHPEKIPDRCYASIKHTEKAKKKMSIKAKEREQKKREEGFTRPQWVRDKIKETLKGRKFSVETRKKIGQAHKGIYHSEKTKQKISKTKKEYHENNDNAFKGKHHSEKTKQKLREANLYKFRGEKGPNWQGGIDSFPYGIEWTKWLRQAIKERDNWKCKICGENKKLLDIHHINFDKNNNNPNNLITLCKHHHGKANRKVITQTYLKSLINNYYKEPEEEQ